MALDAPVREWDDGCMATSEETTEKNSQRNPTHDRP